MVFCYKFKIKKPLSFSDATQCDLSSLNNSASKLNQRVARNVVAVDTAVTFSEMYTQ